MIAIQDLVCGYGSKRVFDGLTAEFESGKLSVIIGPNGCGKSTLLKAAVGLLDPESGSVRVDGALLADLRQNERAKRIGYLAQSRSIPDMTAGQLVLHGRFAHLSYPRIYRQVDHKIAASAMRQMGVDAYADQPLSALSGGMRQNVYLAMLLCAQTGHLLLDEPTTYLDIAARISFLEQARALADAGKTVVMVLHDIPLALQYADRVYLMKEGQMVFSGSPEQVYASGMVEKVFGVPLYFDESNRRYYF